MIQNKNGDFLWMEFPHLSPLPLRHFITTRLGGMSLVPYLSLNLGLHVEDTKYRVIANRKIVADALGFPMESLVLGEQVHGCNVSVVQAEDAGKGAYSHEECLPETDALITQEPGLVLCVNVADCVPIILADPLTRSVGVIHAGWRGSFEQIAIQTVKKMQQEFGTRPENLHAGIGPGIGPCCYEVDPELFGRFQEKFGNLPQSIADESTRTLNLPLLNALQLQSTGIPKANIQTAPYCTSCHNDLFFSHRKEKGSGRFWAGVWIP